jgi:hypothetical protein
MLIMAEKKEVEKKPVKRPSTKKKKVVPVPVVEEQPVPQTIKFR